MLSITTIMQKHDYGLLLAAILDFEENIEYKNINSFFFLLSFKVYAKKKYP